MGELRNIEQLRDALRGVQAGMLPAMTRAMRRSCLLVKGTAKENCTPGKSPYPRAPYSDDNDPRREPPHMRDVMYHKVYRDGSSIRGVIGNPKHYALPVHDGHFAPLRSQSKLTAVDGRGMTAGSFVPARPFITDAIKQHQQDIVEIFNDEIGMEILRHCEGRLFGSTPSEMPTAMDEEAEE